MRHIKTGKKHFVCSNTTFAAVPYRLTATTRSDFSVRTVTVINLAVMVLATIPAHLAVIQRFGPTFAAVPYRLTATTRSDFGVRTVTIINLAVMALATIPARFVDPRIFFRPVVERI